MGHEAMPAMWGGGCMRDVDDTASSSAAVLRLIAAYDREVAHPEIYEDLKDE